MPKLREKSTGTVSVHVCENDTYMYNVHVSLPEKCPCAIFEVTNVIPSIRCTCTCTCIWDFYPG